MIRVQNVRRIDSGLNFIMVKQLNIVRIADFLKYCDKNNLINIILWSIRIDEFENKL
jgi:hypothetical protein